MGITPGEEWTILSVNFCPSFCVIITFDRACVQESLVALVSDVHTLINDNTAEVCIIIYTDASVIHSLHSACAFTAQCGGKMITDECGDLAVTSVSLTMGTAAVMKAMKWQKI